jgi:cystathionine gamma-synthase
MNRPECPDAVGAAAPGDWAGARFETAAIHAGQDPDAVTGAVTVPIHLSSTFAQDAVGVPRGDYEYARSANPTRTALETCLAALEAGSVGLAFASGMAAQDAVVRTICRPGDHALIPSDAYGGTYRLFATVFTEWGLDYTPVPLNDPGAVRAALRPGRTRLLWCETPTNPLLGVSDIAALAELIHSVGGLLAVDNTFATPYLQQPLPLGADVSVHSTTKYLGGHSDVVGGAVIAADPALGDRLRFTQNATGAVAGPFDAWLVLRGVKTLAVRMDRHCANARRIAALLATHPAVAAVRYPGLPDDPGYPVAARQMRDFGGMISFSLRGGQDAALEVCRRTRVFTLAESLGGVESLIEHPGRMTHLSVAGSPLEVPADLVRLSVGIESVNDLLDDLSSALATVT